MHLNGGTLGYPLDALEGYWRGVGRARYENSPTPQFKVYHACKGQNTLILVRCLEVIIIQVI